MITEHQGLPDLDYLERCIEVGDGMGRALSLAAVAEIRRLREQLRDARTEQQLWRDEQPPAYSAGEYDGGDAEWVQGL